MRMLWGLLATAALLRPFAVAAQVARHTPEVVVREFFKAEEDGRWLDAAYLLDLKQFESVRRSSVNALRTRPTFVPRTPQELMKWEPEMPLAVAEYQLKQMNEHMRDFDFLAREYARVPSVDSLAALPVDAAAARWLEARGRKWQYEVSRKQRQSRASVQCPPLPDTAQAALKAEWREPVAVILGATERSDSVRYVVIGRSFGPNRLVRNSPGSDAFPEMSPSVITVRKTKDEWRIIPTYDLPTSDGFSGSMVFAIACSTDSVPKSTGDKR